MKTSRWHFEFIAASVWCFPLMAIGLIAAGGPVGTSDTPEAESRRMDSRDSDRANTAPKLGDSKPIVVQMPKVDDRPPPPRTDSTNVAQPTIRPQTQSMAGPQNPIEPAFQRVESMTTEQRDRTVELYRDAQRKGEFLMEIAKTDGISLSQLGDHFLVRTNSTMKLLDKTGYASPPSPHQQQGLCLRLHESQLPHSVRQAIDSDSEIRYSQQIQLQLVLSSVIEIELYRSLYAFVQQQKLKAPRPGHRYQAHLSIIDDVPMARWHDLGSTTPDHP